MIVSVFYCVGFYVKPIAKTFNRFFPRYNEKSYDKETRFLYILFYIKNIKVRKMFEALHKLSFMRHLPDGSK